MGCGAPELVPHWEIGSGWSGFSTTLAFSDGREGELRQHAVTSSLGRLWPSGWGVRASGGAILGGTLRREDGDAVVRAGWTASVQGFRRWNEAYGAVPHVVTSLSISASSASTRSGRDRTPLTATDLRLGVLAGWRVGSVWSPHVAARVFGGPVFWQSRGEALTASDPRHLNAGIGSSFALPGGTSLWVDASVVGEQSLAAGIAVVL